MSEFPASITSISFLLRGPVTPKPDIELACQLKQGDPDALAAAYDQYGLYAYTLLVRVTHDPATAEDLVQEVFLRIWTRIGDYDSSRAPLKVWISSIAHNLAIDSLRSTRRLSSTQVEFPTREVCAGRLNRCESILQDMEFIRKVLSTLTASQRRLLEMIYFEGCSLSEVAQRLETPLGTVKGRVLATLKQLRKCDSLKLAK